MPVGFPGLGNLNRKTIKGPDNPMDRCTIVSIYPKDVEQINPTIQPGRFIIPAGSYEKPSILVVGPSSWWKETDEHSPLLEIPTGSILIAESVVRDYCNGILGCNMHDVMPGLFYIPGELKLVEIQTKYKGLLDKARDNQNRWYAILINMADTLWGQSQGNPLSIGDDMRLAARSLGQNTKEWLQDFQATETVRCVACGSMRNPLFPMCGNCHTIIDQKKFDEMGLKKAQ